MAYKPQNPAPLGGDNEVSWEHESLVIADTTDESLVVLQPKEISCLLSFLIPRVTDEQIDRLILLLFAGLYQFDETELKSMRSAVRDWLAALNQPPAPSLDKDATFITKEEALSMLVDGDLIHTFRGQVVPVGADWPRASILAAMDKYAFELSGPVATAGGHGMAFRDEHGIVFVETKPVDQPPATSH